MKKILGSLIILAALVSCQSPMGTTIAQTAAKFGINLQSSVQTAVVGKPFTVTATQTTARSATGLGQAVSWDVKNGTYINDALPDSIDVTPSGSGLVTVTATVNNVAETVQVPAVVVYTVTVNGVAQTVTDGTVLQAPADLVNDHNTFLGWVDNSAQKNKVTFPLTVTSDLTINANWDMNHDKMLMGIWAIISNTNITTGITTSFTITSSSYLYHYDYDNNIGSYYYNTALTLTAKNGSNTWTTNNGKIIKGTGAGVDYIVTNTTLTITSATNSATYIKQ